MDDENETITLDAGCVRNGCCDGCVRLAGANPFSNPRAGFTATGSSASRSAGAERDRGQASLH